MNILSKKLKLYAIAISKNYKLIHAVINDAINYGSMSVRFTNYIKQGNVLNLEDSNVLSDEQINWFLNEVDNERKQYEQQSFIDIERCGSFGLVIQKNLISIL